MAGILSRVGKPVENLFTGDTNHVIYPLQEGSEQDPALQVPQYIVQATFRAVSDLSNHIAHVEAHSSLMKIKSLHPAVFSSPFVFVCVHKYLGSYTYELRVRQFLLGLFHQGINFDKMQIWALLDRQPQV